MKRKLLPVVALVVAAAVLPASAGAQMVPYVGGGISTGTGDFGDYTDNGWTVFAGVVIPIASYPGLGLNLSAAYSRFNHKEGEGATNVPQAMVGLEYLMNAAGPGMVKPFVGAAVGALQHRYDPGGTGYSSESETKFAAGAGAGLNFVMQSFTPFVGAYYTYAEDTSFMTFYAGVGFSGSGAGNAIRFLRR